MCCLFARDQLIFVPNVQLKNMELPKTIKARKDGVNMGFFDRFKKAVKQEYIPIMLATVVFLCLAGCTACTAASAADLMNGMSPNLVNGRQADSAFISSMANFSIELFKDSLSDKENSLVSPLSVMLALAMTAGGAGKETLVQMEKLLGGDIPLAELNEYLYSFAKGLPNAEKSKLHIANSIWFRDRLQVKPDFLQRNADYYGASAYQAAFDSQTVKDINNWVKSNTDGMIERILDQISFNHVMFLVNAVTFDAQWQTTYTKESVIEGEFTDINGIKQNIDFMHSTEHKYLDDGRATGFIKAYSDGYSFAVLLPNEDISLEEYIGSLSGEKFLDTLNNRQEREVIASLPKFKYEYEIQLNDALKRLGIPDAFDEEKADFSKMADLSDGNIFINEVLHKTFISVDELGTKAGAVTMVAMTDASAPIDEPKVVRLDRPFVYAIIDNATKLPIFIGTVARVGNK